MPSEMLRRDEKQNEPVRVGVPENLVRCGLNKNARDGSSKKQDAIRRFNRCFAWFLLCSYSLIAVISCSVVICVVLVWSCSCLCCVVCCFCTLRVFASCKMHFRVSTQEKGRTKEWIFLWLFPFFVDVQWSKSQVIFPIPRCVLRVSEWSVCQLKGACAQKQLLKARRGEEEETREVMVFIVFIEYVPEMMPNLSLRQKELTLTPCFTTCCVYMLLLLSALVGNTCTFRNRLFLLWCLVRVWWLRVLVLP